MANELEVDAVGLRIAATASETATARTLSGTPVTGSASSQPSATGVQAVNAALVALQRRQAQRITGQAGDLTISSARYDTTDEFGAGAISTVSI